MKLDALERYPNGQFMDLGSFPILPPHLRVARLQQDVWQALKNQVHVESRFTCFYCGVDARPTQVCDHLMPLCRGGTNHRANLVTACSPCNRSKGMLTAYEFMAKLRGAMRQCARAA